MKQKPIHFLFILRLVICIIVFLTLILIFCYDYRTGGPENKEWYSIAFRVIGIVGWIYIIYRNVADLKTIKKEIKINGRQ